MSEFSEQCYRAHLKEKEKIKEKQWKKREVKKGKERKGKEEKGKEMNEKVNKGIFHLEQWVTSCEKKNSFRTSFSLGLSLNFYKCFLESLFVKHLLSLWTALLNIIFWIVYL